MIKSRDAFGVKSLSMAACRGIIGVPAQKGKHTWEGTKADPFRQGCHILDFAAQGG
jgi:hypothetical protein